MESTLFEGSEFFLNNLCDKLGIGSCCLHTCRLINQSAGVQDLQEAQRVFWDKIMCQQRGRWLGPKPVHRLWAGQLGNCLGGYMMPRDQPGPEYLLALTTKATPD